MMILVAGRAAQALLTIAGFRLLTTLLPPAEVGHYYLLMSLAALFGMFLLGPVGMYLNRKLFHWHDNGQVFEHFLGYNAYSLVVSLLAFFVVLAANRLFGTGGGMPGGLFAFSVACYIYVLNWNQNFIPALNTLGHRVSFVLLTITSTALGLAFSVLFSKFLGREALSWTAGLIVALGLITVASAFLFRHKVREARPEFFGFSRYLKTDTLKVVAAFSVPLSLAAFFMWAQAQSYRIIVEKANGPELLAYLSVGFSIATSIAGILESLVQQIFLPGYYRSISSGDKAAREKALSGLVSCTMPVYIVYLFFVAGSAEFLVNFLVDAKYKDVAVYARYGALIEFFRMSTNILASAAHSEMRTAVLIRPYLAGGLVAALTVAAAAQAPVPEAWIPPALVVSGIVTLLTMRSSIRQLVSLETEPGRYLLPSLCSVPFLALILVPGGGMLRSAALLCVSGAYFIFLQAYFSRRCIATAGKPAETPMPDPNMSQAEEAM